MVDLLSQQGATTPAFKRHHKITHNVENIDIYPLLMHLMDIFDAPANNGSFARISSILAGYPDRTEVHEMPHMTTTDSGYLLPLILVSGSVIYLLRRFS